MHVEWISSYLLSKSIINKLESPDNFLLIQKDVTSLPTGAFYYSYIIEPKGNVESLEELTREISNITYQSLSFSINLSDQDGILVKREIAQGVEEILIAYLNKKLGINIAEIEKTYFTDPSTLRLVPSLESGYKIYYSNQEIEEIHTELEDLEVIKGYKILSSDPLIWFYLDENQVNVSPFNWKGLALIPITSNIDDDTLLSETKLLVPSLRRDGFFVIDNPIAPEDRRSPHSFTVQEEIYLQLSEMWNIDYFGDKEGGLVFKSKSRTPEWITQSVRNIQQGSLPNVYVGGDWVQFVEPSLRNIAILQAAANLAYREIGTIWNNTLLDFEIKVMPNLLFSAFFSSIEEEKKFLEVFTRSYLPRINNWQVKEIEASTCSNSPLCVDLQQENAYLVEPSEGEVDLYPQLVDQQVPQPRKTQQTIELMSEPVFEAQEGVISIDGIPLVEIEGEVEEVIASMQENLQDLLTPWGLSYIIWQKPERIDRSFFFSEEILKESFNFI